MVLERELQKTIIRWLRSKGCIVLKYQQNATTRSGVPDVMWCYKSKYGFLEVKRSKTAKFQPGQKEIIDKLSNWTYAKVVFPENWGIIKEEISMIIENENM